MFLVNVAYALSIKAKKSSLKGMFKPPQPSAVCPNPRVRICTDICWFFSEVAIGSYIYNRSQMFKNWRFALINNKPQLACQRSTVLWFGPCHICAGIVLTARLQFMDMQLCLRRNSSRATAQHYSSLGCTGPERVFPSLEASACHASLLLVMCVASFPSFPGLCFSALLCLI